MTDLLKILSFLTGSSQETLLTAKAEMLNNLEKGDLSSADERKFVFEKLANDMFELYEDKVEVIQLMPMVEIVGEILEDHMKRGDKNFLQIFNRVLVYFYDYELGNQDRFIPAMMTFSEDFEEYIHELSEELHKYSESLEAGKTGNTNQTDPAKNDKYYFTLPKEPISDKKLLVRFVSSMMTNLSAKEGCYGLLLEFNNAQLRQYLEALLDEWGSLARRIITQSIRICYGGSGLLGPTSEAMNTFMTDVRHAIRQPDSSATASTLMPAYVTPTDPEVYIKRAQKALADSNQEQAVLESDAALKYCTEGKRTNYLDFKTKAITCKGSEQFERAIQYCDAAIKLDNSDAEIYFIRAFSQSMMGNDEAALSDYDRTITLNKSHDAAYNNRALIYSGKGKISEATYDLKKAVDLAPAEVKYRNNYADELISQKKYEKAYETLEYALINNNAECDAKTYYMMGLACDGLKRYLVAQKHFKIAQAMDGTYTIPYNASRNQAISHAKKVSIIAMTIAGAVTAVMLFLFLVIVPGMKYTEATMLYADKQYTEAYKAFEELGRYKDSPAKALECKRESQYIAATDFFNDKMYIEAASAFSELGEFRDCEAKTIESYYLYASILYEDGYYSTAAEFFAEISSYKDSVVLEKECLYAYASSLYQDKNYAEAEVVFEQLDDYKDSNWYEIDARYKQKINSTESVAEYVTESDSEAATEVASELISEPTPEPTLKPTPEPTPEPTPTKPTVIETFATLEEYIQSSIYRASCLIDSGFSHIVGLKNDGTLIVDGSYSNGALEVESWQDIVAISAGFDDTIGLKKDGTLVGAGQGDYGRTNFSSWQDIVAISAGAFYTVGIVKDGTVVAVGDNQYEQCNVSSWNNIVAVSAGNFHTLGLKADGTVVACGDNSYGQCDVSEWTDIVSVCAGRTYSIGIKKDGTVVGCGDNDYGKSDVSEWADIVAVAAADDHTIGLKRDGTVVAVGLNEDGEMRVSEWTDIVAIATTSGHTLGLKKDGTAVVVGDDDYGEWYVDDWSDILLQ